MEQFERIEQVLAELEAAPGDLAILDGLFRSLHAFKGAAGLPELARLRVLAGQCEDLLGDLRGGRRAVTAQAIDLLFETEALLKIQVEAVGLRLRGEALPAEPAAPGAAAAQGGVAILLADDDEMVRLSVLDVLEVLGHRATAVASGEAALAELAAGCRPDLVMLDMTMPGLGGAGTLPRIRAMIPALPVLIMTGKADQAVLDLGRAYPHVAVLAKPFSLGELQQALAPYAPDRP